MASVARLECVIDVLQAKNCDTDYIVVCCWNQGGGGIFTRPIKKGMIIRKVIKDEGKSIGTYKMILCSEG